MLFSPFRSFIEMKHYTDLHVISDNLVHYYYYHQYRSFKKTAKYQYTSHYWHRYGWFFTPISVLFFMILRKLFDLHFFTVGNYGMVHILKIFREVTVYNWPIWLAHLLCSSAQSSIYIDEVNNTFAINKFWE